MLTLYIKEGCPFCAMVTDFISNIDLDVEMKEIGVPENLEELLKIGGKRQVPFLTDKAIDKNMYESADIIEHLQKNYT